MSEGPHPGLEALFIAELNERLFVQFLHGRWCAPFSDRLCPVGAFDGVRVAQIACANARDIQRAMVGLARAPDVTGDLASAYDTVRTGLRALRQVEGYDDPAAPATVCSVPPGDRPLILLSAAATPVSALVGVLMAGAARGVLWKPAPRAAASAHLVMRALGPAAGGRLALVQGDHQTGAAMVGEGALVWASPAPVAQGLGQPVLSLGATVPRHP